mgnify:CR=1 FL=1
MRPGAESCRLPQSRTPWRSVTNARLPSPASLEFAFPVVTLRAACEGFPLLRCSFISYLILSAVLAHRWHLFRAGPGYHRRRVRLPDGATTAVASDSPTATTDGHAPTQTPDSHIPINLYILHNALWIHIFL